MATDAPNFEYTSSTVPPGALFVAADEPLLVYPSVAAAERDLEAIDVENGVYPAAYGPNGEPYRVTSEGNCVIVKATGEPSRPDELRLLLLRYLEAMDRAPDATARLADLVAIVWAVESDFWNEHDPYGDRFGTRISRSGCAAFVMMVAVVLYFVFR